MEHKAESTSPGTLFPVTFRMELTSLATSYSTPTYQLVNQRTSQQQSTSGNVNISWDPLPYHLQNEVNISGYIIQCTRLPNGVSRNISSSDSLLECRQEPGGPYSCMVAISLFIGGVSYSFQVTVDNVHGITIGSFSDPVTTVFSAQGMLTV